jgi:hypothetical protein
MITNYYAYSDDGEILVCGICPESQLKLQYNLFKNIKIGKAKVGKQYVDDNDNLCNIPDKPNEYYFFNYKLKQWELDLNIASSENKNKRIKLLEESDWTDTLSAKTRLGETLYNQWQEYRQALRDITNQDGFPENIIWPTLPE